MGLLLFPYMLFTPKLPKGRQIDHALNIWDNMDIYSNNDWEDDFSFFFSGRVFVVIFGIHQQTYHGSILIF